MARFSDVADLQISLGKEFTNNVHSYLLENEKLARDTAGFILKKIEEAPREERQKVFEALNRIAKTSAAFKTEAITRIENAIEQVGVSPDTRKQIISEISNILLKAAIGASVAGVGSSTSFFNDLIRLLIR